jgi:hypothetical protein
MVGWAARSCRIILARHVAPHFRARPIDRLSPEGVEAFLAAQARSGAARQSVLNRHCSRACGRRRCGPLERLDDG